MPISFRNITLFKPSFKDVTSPTILKFYFLYYFCPVRLRRVWSLFFSFFSFFSLLSFFSFFSFLFVSFCVTSLSFLWLFGVTSLSLLWLFCGFFVFFLSLSKADNPNSLDIVFWCHFYIQSYCLLIKPLRIYLP